jgi:hypothetical protein
MWSLAIPLATAALGYKKERDQQKATEKFNQGQIESNRYSPWTGVRNELRENTADPLGGAIGGGLAGASMMQQFGGFNAAKPENPTMAMNDKTYMPTNMNKPTSIYDSIRKKNPYSPEYDSGRMNT